jgi:MFS family permease
VLTHYRAAFRAPGTAAFASAGFVMRMPSAIYPLGLVLIISAKTGHYGFAGILAGLWTFANGVGQPVLARAIDRFGQGRVLLPATVVEVASSIVLGILIQAKAPDWSLVLPTVVTAFSFLPVGSLVRARWSYVYDDEASRPALSTAYSFESTLDEVIYTVGPLIATVLAIWIYPLAVLIACVLLVGCGAIWLHGQHSTEPPSLPQGAPPHASPLRSRGMFVILLVAAGMGFAFSTAEVTMVAFCGQHGQRSASGLAMGTYAFGSAIAGFTYGARHWKLPLLDRFRIQCAVFGVMPVLFLAGVTVPALICCALVVGLATAPLAITAFSLVEEFIPGESLTEGLAWLVTGISLGYGTGSAIAGHIADAHGARVGFVLTIGAGVAVFILGLVQHSRLSGRVSVPAAA